jgi:hypothetical protein
LRTQTPVNGEIQRIHVENVVSAAELEINDVVDVGAWKCLVAMWKLRGD